MPTHVKFSWSHLIECLPCILPQRALLCPGLYLRLHLNFITTLWKRYFAHVSNVRKRTHREIKYLALGSQTHNPQVTQPEFNNRTVCCRSLYFQLLTFTTCFVIYTKKSSWLLPPKSATGPGPRVTEAFFSVTSSSLKAGTGFSLSHWQPPQHQA